MRVFLALLALLAMSGSAVGHSAPESAEPIQVMVLGTYHFDSPGLDLNNPKVDDVLKPNRQRELERLADALTVFRPTKIMIERVPKTADMSDRNYAGFTTADLSKTRDERVQIAYRLASRLRMPVVHAIDEQPAAGEPDYFPFQPIVDWAKANKAEQRLEKLMANGAAAAAKLEADQKVKSIPQMLLERNRSDAISAEQSLYYEFLGFGDLDRQPGADLNAMWYLRNAKIFNKLQQAAKPGDRVLVIYGSGHNYWLRHFAATASGYQLIDPEPFLEQAAR